ncbi:MAG TPA: permease-like cell division protein FtsX [Thermoanaerobaculia bacterium]|jgi:cell division transport system permease protein|nr:permease-like cell division protein FtsX [Thermoanaerobaculia bacterium]
MARDFIPGRREPEVPSNAFSYFFREAVRRIWISKRTSFVAVAMITISLLILGSFLLVAENLERAVTQWQGKSRVNIYLEAEATPEEIRAVDTFLAARPTLAQRHFVTREQALARFRSYFSNLSEVVGQLDENPFPPSFEVEVTPAIAQSPGFDRDMKQLRRIAGVEQVQFDWEWLNRLKRIISIVNLAGLVAGGVLAIAAAFTIANVIRLTMMLYREEIEIMRLVGATERIIRGPFLIEGLLQGTLGGVLAVGLLFLLFEVSRRAIPPSSSLLWGFLFVGFLPWQKIAALVAGGMLAGWFGSWLSVRERPSEET